jgi:arylsulfatase
MSKVRIWQALRKLLTGTAFLAIAVTAAHTQQITGAPGSPGATTTLDGKQLPPPIRNSAG